MKRDEGRVPSVEVEQESTEGTEVFHNMLKCFGWLHVMPDLQIIGSSRRQIGTLLVPGKKIDTAVVTGLQVKIDF